MIKSEHVVPKFPQGESGEKVVGMVTAVQTEVSSAWLDWIEGLFAIFGEVPKRGSASFTNDFGRNRPGSGGQFKNIRKKVATMLDTSSLTDRTLFVGFSSREVDDLESFGRGGSVNVTIGKAGHFVQYDPRVIVSWSVHCPPADNPLEVLDRIDRSIIFAFAPLYGFSTFWPEIWNWSLPVWGQGYVPNNWDQFHDADNMIYSKRMYRSPTDREWDYPLENGWLREVYTVNLINDRHLAAPFNGATLGDYIATHGTLARNIHGSELHRWHVPDDIIDKVRNDLESSGLILSSETEPVALPE